MARYNQQAGRTPEAWRARYEAREERFRATVEALAARGIKITVVETPVQIAGPGVPGHSRACLTARLDDKVIPRRTVNKMAREMGLLNEHGALLIPGPNGNRQCH